MSFGLGLLFCTAAKSVMTEAGGYRLANDKISVTVSEAGKLDSVENRLAGDTYRFNADTFLLETDQGVFSNATSQPSKVTAGKDRMAFSYAFSPGISVDLVYTLSNDNGFFRRTLSLSNATPLRLKNLVLGATAFARPAAEVVHYVTFIAAPTVEFIRHDKGGLFTGIENPYFKADVSEQGVALGFELTLNGGKVAPLRWDDPSHSAVFDLTDLVKYGGENSVTLFLKRMASNHFMGPYLIYPEEGSTDKLLPGPGAADLRVVYKQSLVPALPPRYRKNAGPKVIEAKMMENVTLREAAELRVTLDLPPEKIKRVMFFESGFGWMGQHGLGYNKKAQCWTARVTPGPRAAIQENDFIYVWTEGTDGLRSDYYPVNVGWDFTAARKAKVVAGAIEAEFLKVQSKSRSKVEPQDMAPYGNHWSGGSQMVWWGGLEQGDSMVLEIPLEKAGVYALAMHLSKAEDYGIFSVRLDDGPETEAMDFFHSKLQPPTIITLKPMTLAKGKHSLRITCHGKNPKSSNSLIGIDCLEFKETTR
ncbi:MAG: hypothetical protein K9M45_07875 [Kiritimatiellales bacterium]|nr:hypothetical protein [Kiritimatiellales bacterium]